jgi:hypothetical protein
MTDHLLIFASENIRFVITINSAVMRILMLFVGLVLLSAPLHAQSSKKRKMEAEVIKADAYAITDCMCKAGTARIEAAQSGSDAKVRQSVELHRHLDLMEARLSKKYEAEPGRKVKYERLREEARTKLTSCQNMLNARRGGEPGRQPGRQQQRKPNK